MTPPLLSDAKILAELPQGWMHEDGHLRRSFSFPDFPAALGFMVRVGFVCEAMNHHPNWSNVYATVQVDLWTHDAGGVTQLDLDLAGRMNELSA